MIHILINISYRWFKFKIVLLVKIRCMNNYSLLISESLIVTNFIKDVLIFDFFSMSIVDQFNCIK